MITIDEQKCSRCGSCVAVCPAMVIELDEKAARYMHEQSCIGCHQCVAICPGGSVTCEEFSLDAFKKIGKAEIPSPEAMRNLLWTRRSVRVFKDKPVPRELLERLIETASQAPTSHNTQTTCFNIITDRSRIIEIDLEIMKTFERLIARLNNPVGKQALKLMGGGTMAAMLSVHRDDLKRFRAAEPPRSYLNFRNAPVLALAHAGPEASDGKDDCVIAMTHVMFDAIVHGLGATWNGNVVSAVKYNAALKRPLGIPKNHTLHASIILGWPKYKYQRTIPRKTIPVKWFEAEEKLDADKGNAAAMGDAS